MSDSAANETSVELEVEDGNTVEATISESTETTVTAEGEGTVEATVPTEDADQEDDA